MFNSWFIHTRSSLDALIRRLRLLGRLVTVFTQLFFIAYYVYLITINTEKLGFLIVYICLLAISIVMLIIELIYMFKKYEDRYEKRQGVEHKRTLSLIFKIIKVLLKLTAIVLSGYELMHYGGSDLQVISLTLSIVFLLASILVNIFVTIAIHDIDTIRLSFMMDVENSKVLSLLIKKENNYTEKESKIREGINALTERFLNRKDK